ncbi:hydroxymethylbilane synthase [Catalinimonas alkaloidigena]|uniref:Porphobilinogen deaminase n=1 Tax=Catalinimonas alkaloidigena TaxID=1075417 RepID=A0A1G9UR24_9BACT|nr:hydroxymethylbilane synthase [Catalinimonas alkaloidigena]SDM61985.1 hydroxymethylbilane synthase [Catalinimonas alkaloidigena]
MQTIRIGTRGSQLALWQAHHVADLLRDAGLAPEIVTIETKGDKILDVSLAKIGSKGVFTQELEDGLRDGSIDIAVHSAKDMPSQLPDDLELIAFTERELAGDVLVSALPDVRLDDPSRRLVVGTSSTRRRAILRRFYPHVTLVDMRGNLQTRMRKMAEGQCEALLLAYAGVHRMGYDDHIAEMLPLDPFTPAVGQGSVTIEAATTLDATVREQIRQAVNHPATETCLRAERAFLRRLQGGCSIPVFGMARWDENQIVLSGGIVSLEGDEFLREEAQEAPQAAEALGIRVAERLLARGADRILRQIRHSLS